MAEKRKFLYAALLIIALLLSVAPAALQDTAGGAGPTNVLVWMEDGPSASESSPSAAGQLGLIDGTGAFTEMMEIPAQTSRLRHCGDQAISPDGTMFAFYVGLEQGSLYMMDGTGTPVAVDEVNALTCMGGGTFQYAPDSTSLAYIDFEPDATASEFADGFLRVKNGADLSEMFSSENVIAFDITNEGVGFVSFFTNDRNEADEAAVFWWNGSAEREIATLRPDENCRYTSSSVAITPDGNLLIIMGHRCLSGDTRTSWQLYRVDVQARSATLAATEFSSGQFASFSRTNQITILPNDNAAMFTVPDGVTANTVSLLTVNLDDLSTSTIIERQAVFPTLNQGSNVFPLVSPDSRWLALVVTSPSNDNTLHVYDLQDLTVAPITVSAGSRNDIIADMAFSADSNWLIFIAGSESTGRNADNSLIALDLNAGSDFRIKRGRFARGLAVSPDGSKVVVQDAEVLEDEREPTYLNLVEIDVNTSETALLFEGADIVEGKVTNQRFAKPLIWR
jgi:hypothetical protein